MKNRKSEFLMFRLQSLSCMFNSVWVSYNILKIKDATEPLSKERVRTRGFVVIKSWYLFSLILFLAACSGSRVNIQADIDKANSCKTPKDCVNLGSHCPFGCDVLVNQSEKSSAKKLIDLYNQSNPSQCSYGCLSLKEIKCIASKCTAIYGDK